MPTSKQLATHLQQVYFGGNWTDVNFKDTLSGIDFDTAKQQLEGFNSILALTFHIHYFIKGVTNVFKGGALEIRDKYSFDHPELTSEKEWNDFKEQLWQEAEEFIDLLSNFPNEKLDDDFTDAKYGDYGKNMLGLIEHTHYHLGQIVILNKMIKKG
ncbi:DinB family protein [Winogradskyella ursingii]|uniref:DinB family protein n=1 Tax=Winogradskyella ursingii TaxID=2686079 RepID=UPI0015C96DD0|nr:DinB family protein [Winogradskyella ursingii]